MEQDKTKTKVDFRMDNADIDYPDVFPEEYSDVEHKYMTCYAHAGQHSGCEKSFYLDLPKATPKQYADLKQELESIGYNLEVII